MVALRGFIGQMCMNADYAIYCVDLNWMHANQLLFPQLAWSCFSSSFYFPHFLATYVLSLLVLFCTDALLMIFEHRQGKAPCHKYFLGFFFFFLFTPLWQWSIWPRLHVLFVPVLLPDVVLVLFSCLRLDCRLIISTLFSRGKPLTW